MDVHVLEAEGLPPDAIITFKVGSERKQSIIQVGQSCKLPRVSTSSCTVSILRHVGTAELPVPKDSKDVATVQVQPADGRARKVILRSSAAKKTDHSTAKEEWKANGQALDTVQTLMADVLREQPADPYAFMLRQLRSSQAQRGVDLEVSQASRKSLEDGQTSVTKFVRDEVMGHFDSSVSKAIA
eukprot:TRINITY_DN68566_c0_g1_i1.p1 TRINITY_DN68566_c0_g1~~TRINITY_DN68566_c0_g1_i1.p1  ORF type:complete len:185 (+),score=40.27 TRINITY_DN68566_c0_g1_i1:75-629(+)